jgi:hypothetical protein
MADLYMLGNVQYELERVARFEPYRGGGLRIITSEGPEGARDGYYVRIGTLVDWNRLAAHDCEERTCGIPFKCRACQHICGACIGCDDECDRQYGPMCDDCAVQHPEWKRSKKARRA